MAKTSASKAGSKRRVTFRYPSQEAREVLLLGDFNGWEIGAHPLRRAPDGSWRRILMLSPGRYEYKFLVDGHWEYDPGNPHHCDNRQGSENCVMEIAR